MLKAHVPAQELTKNPHAEKGMPFLATIEGQFAFGRQPVRTQPTGIVTQDLLLYLDAGNVLSYPGTGTTWTDLSSNANNATSLTGTTYSSSNSGYLTFNGTSGSGSLVASKYNTPYTGKTIFVVGNLATALSVSQYRAFLGASPGDRNFNFYLYSPSSGTYQLHFSSGGIGTLSSNVTYTVGTWFTAAVTQQTDGTLIYYFNGAVVNTTSQSFSQFLSGATEWVGRADNYWNGPLSVITVYKTALTTAQILQNHNAVYSRYPPSSGASILALARTIATTYSGQTIAPTAGGSLTINSQLVGNYEYAVAGTTTVSAFNAADWFSSTKDTVSSWIIINGDLTINSGQTFTPSVRKLFTVIYVTGNLVCNGTISMNARGANHSGTGDSGGATTAVDIRIGTGTFSAVVNPQIPAAGGAGGAAKLYNSGGANYNNGTAGTNGGTGGGGTGETYLGTATAAAGSAGTCFSGGTGSGGAFNANSSAGEANGGAGGAGSTGGANTGGGTGNPGGSGFGSGGVSGSSGTGGTLIIICAGALSGSGTINANGVNSTRPAGSTGGGASGAGSVTVLFATNPGSAVTVAATGGTGQASGNGGNGTARKLAIGAN